MKGVLGWVQEQVGEIHAPQHCILDLILLVTALAEFRMGKSL